MLVVLALPYAASTRLVRDRIAHEMSEWSGLDVSIGAAPEISFWPDLQANLTDVTLSPPGTAKAPAITAERVEIELSALAALRRRCRFFAARASSGRPSGSRADAGAAPALPGSGRIARAIETAREIVAENRAAPDTGRLPADEFGIVEFSDGRIVAVLRRGRDGDRHRAFRKDRLGEAERAGDRHGHRQLAGRAVHDRPRSANPLLFLGGAPAPLTASLKSAPANLAFDGTASLGENPYVDGQVNFSAPSASEGSRMVAEPASCTARRSAPSP